MMSDSSQRLNFRRTRFYQSLRQIRFFRLLFRNLLFLKLAFREGLWRLFIGNVGKNKRIQKQKILTWRVFFPDIDTIAELRLWLKGNGIIYCEGGHTLYLPPQSNLTKIIPDVVAFYPKDTGFKILKDLRPPDEANYISDNSVLAREMIVGTPIEQLVTGNYLFTNELGSRLWDVCEWRSKNTKVSFTVFVVEHILGKHPTEEQFNIFLERLREVIQSGYLRILLPNWQQHADFLPPDCNRNLIQTDLDDSPQYIDFQNFSLTDVSSWTRDVIAQAEYDFHFGGGRLLRGKQYLYQSVPMITRSGKRNTQKRWDQMSDLLLEHGVSVENRVVLDIGCNAGMILHSALSAGALWGLGWDRPQIADQASELLFSLGNSRFHIIGADLEPAYRLENDIPSNLQNHLNEAVVFFLSIHQHIGGILNSLCYLPWRIMVLEGHQGEDEKKIMDVLEPIKSHSVEIVGFSNMADGDSLPRPLITLLKK